MSIRSYFKTRTGYILGLLFITPLFMLPMAPCLWLVMVAIGFAPMTWKGLFTNWLILCGIFIVPSLFGVLTGKLEKEKPTPAIPLGDDEDEFDELGDDGLDDDEIEDEVRK